MGYATDIQGFKDSLDTVVKSTTTFGATNAFFDYIKNLTSYPAVLMRLESDRVTPRGPSETEHLLTFRIIVHHQGTGTEADLNSVIGYVGEIVDAIEADRDLSNSKVMNTEHMQTTYSSRADVESFVLYYAHIIVEVQAFRNV